jgi:cellulose synthase/poly-beta-1,6-N-acetylglucosamine synthase-like glycosyltransferase/peptidoglycan/xylan/chitin deacetylase (PgdA/CDA1 family)
VGRHHFVRQAPPPRVHWVLLAFTLLLVGGGLGVDAIVLHQIGAKTPEDVPGVTVPAELTTGGALIDARDGIRSTGVPDRTMLLTFDDGPDPAWTPRVLDVLARHDISATFFVTAANAAKHPALVRRLIAEGHEIGNHGTTHADLGTSSATRAKWELKQNQAVLAGTAGRTSGLMRPPYSSTPDTANGTVWTAIQRGAELGYVTVLSDLDTKDWSRPGTDRIIAAGTPVDDRGAIVLMHDGGGDRSQTVAAIDQLIPAMLERGWRFATVSAAVGAWPPLGAAAEGPAAGFSQRLLGWASVATVQLARLLGTGVVVLLVIATILALARAIVVMAAAAAHRRRHRGPPPLVRGRRMPPVTVIVPAYNEEAGIESTLRSILASNHPGIHVLVVDDGSTDATSQIVRWLNLPGVTLVRQANAGKAAALNTGIRMARTEFLVLVDGDTVLERDAIPQLLAPFADPRVGAVSGNAKVGNRRGLLGRWQHIEYVIGFNLDRRMYDVLECMPTVPGAVGAFRTRAIIDVGGVPEDTLAEDTDLTMAVLRTGWRVVYAEHARAWTEAPSGLRQLWKQRYRWCYGTLQAMYKHRHAVLERGPAGRLGRRGLPYLLLFQVLLPVLAPVVDIAAIYALVLQPAAGLTAWLAFMLLQLIPAFVAFRWDRERLGPLWALPLQQVVYRQLMYLVVVQSVWTAVAGARLPWHKLRRTGEAAVDAPAPVR